MRYIGVDLAWGLRGWTGLAVAESSRIQASATLRTDSEILAWINPWLDVPAIVAFDAPLVVSNESGMRPCERILHRAFAKHHAGPYPAHRGLPAFRSGPRAGWLAAQLALDLDAHRIPGATSGRFAIEVYPHAALVALRMLDRIIPYKTRPRRTLPQRHAAFQQLLGALMAFQSMNPPLDVRSGDRWNSLAHAAVTASGAALQRAEDELDAHLCAYIAMFHHAHGPPRSLVIGHPTETGAIVTPATPRLLALSIDQPQ
jgi:predicted RNase H-like nuclease